MLAGREDHVRSRPTNILSVPPQVGLELNSSMTGLQAEKERLMRSVSEKEAELSSLRQSAQAQQSSLQAEREKSSKDLGTLQSKLQEKVGQLLAWSGGCLSLAVNLAYLNPGCVCSCSFCRPVTRSG